MINLKVDWIFAIKNCFKEYIFIRMLFIYIFVLNNILLFKRKPKAFLITIILRVGVWHHHPS